MQKNWLQSRNSFRPEKYAARLLFRARNRGGGAGGAARSRAFFSRYSPCILQERSTAQARASLYWQRITPSVTVCLVHKSQGEISRSGAKRAKGRGVGAWWAALGALETKGVHRRADRKSWKRWTRGRSNTIDGREEIPRERAGIAILSCSLSSGEQDLILECSSRQLGRVCKCCLMDSAPSWR